MYISKSFFAILTSLPLSFSSPLPLSEHGATEARQVKPVYPAVRFLNTFPSTLFTGQTLDLAWTGGDGDYELYHLEEKDGKGAWKPMYYTHNTTDTSISLIMRDAVSPNITLNFGIAEANPDVLVEQRWSLSGPIPFVQAE